MELQNKRILVTGADGFIGSHLVEKLIEQGYQVRAFVYYNSFNTWGWLDSLPKTVKQNLDVFSGDIRDSHCVRQAMKDCQVVMHLAALIGIPYSYIAPDSYVDTNIKGAVNILQAAQDMGVEKIVHTSTSEVYGTAQFVPITEDHPLQGQSPYSASKIGADQLALSFYTSFNTPVCVMRPFNTYGLRQSARAVVPTIITQIAAGMDEIKLGSLTPTRDFNYVKDVVNAFIAMAKSDKVLGEVVNIGNQYDISIGDLVQLIAKLMGKKIKVVSETKRVRPDKSEVERLCADNSKALKLLDWRPIYEGRDGLTQGLQETIAWFTQMKNLTFYKYECYNI